ncbi:hypothetical protein M892_20265 [Vibrio campbellii ATCC BAA-1116]|nr:hypothetical protein M892_20265 [Vibrio campbellii ATCC BAA-1116]
MQLSLSFDKLQTGKRFARVFWMEAALLLKSMELNQEATI